MKYINAFFEGNLLKYTLDEPLVERNRGTYYFKLDISNFNEARNSEWKRLYESGCLCAISFKNDKSSESKSDYLIEKKFLVNTDNKTIEKIFLTAKVPESQLIGRGRLQFGVRFFINKSDTQLDTTALNDFLAIETNSTTSYGTIELTNPPMIYPSNQFTTTIDVTDDTRLSTLLGTLSGGSENSILVKKTDEDYDVTWVTSLPGALIYGGSGGFINVENTTKLEVTLTPRAQELLYQSGAITSRDITTTILNPDEPEKYDCLEFIVIGDASNVNTKYHFNDEITEVYVGDRLISDGTKWRRVSATSITLDQSQLLYGTVKIGEQTIPNYLVQIAGSAYNINLNTLGLFDPSESNSNSPVGLANTRNIINFAGKVSDLITGDTVLNWSSIGNCIVYITETDSQISAPTNSDETSVTREALIKNNICITEDNTIIVQEWIGLKDYKHFFRVGDSENGWSQWFEYFIDVPAAENSRILSILRGGTGANNITKARENLDVYSKNEVVQNFIYKHTSDRQDVEGPFFAPNLNIVNSKDSSDAGKVINWFTTNEENPYAKITATPGKGLVLESRSTKDETFYERYKLTGNDTELTEDKDYDFLTTKNVWVRDEIPDTVAPAGTFCFVKVKE